MTPVEKMLASGFHHKKSVCNSIVKKRSLALVRERTNVKDERMGKIGPEGGGGDN